LVASDEGCVAVWSDDATGDTIGVGGLRYPPAGRKTASELLRLA
jgi:hypothetical protein